MHWWWIRLNFGSFTRFHPSWGRSLQIMKIATGSHRSPSIVDMNPCHFGHVSTWRYPQLLSKTSKKNFLQFTLDFFCFSTVWKFTQKRTLLVTRVLFFNLWFWKFGQIFQNFSNLFPIYTSKKTIKKFQKNCHHSVRIHPKNSNGSQQI